MSRRPKRLIPPPEVLPDPGCHWTAARKQLVLRALDLGQVTLDELAARYRMTVDEVLLMRAKRDRAGIAGLRSDYQNSRDERLGR